MSLIALLLLAADPSPCELVPKAPPIPRASEFECPGGATASASGNGVECIARDGKPTGDTFAIEGKTGLMVHPLGLSVSWSEGGVTWWHQRPSGHRVVYEGGKLARIEHLTGGELNCARHYDGAKVFKRYDDGKWTWLDSKGKAIGLKAPLERGEMAQALKEHQAEVQLCYEARLREVKGDFRGKIGVSVSIENGEAKNVSVVEDTLRDPPVSECLVARLQAWRFRPSEEAVEVVFPFVFKESR
ncbi:MAG: AgmX/PglI C-terminal domain-containing protein [Archangiaceae bacterium]|nr:AgmX/PglI C-terminal domain-containing protein [Archangiaceae bacterium]